MYLYCLRNCKWVGLTSFLGHLFQLLELGEQCVIQLDRYNHNIRNLTTFQLSLSAFVIFLLSEPNLWLYLRFKNRFLNKERSALSWCARAADSTTTLMTSAAIVPKRRRIKGHAIHHLGMDCYHWWVDIYMFTVLLSLSYFTKTMWVNSMWYYKQKFISMGWKLYSSWCTIFNSLIKSLIKIVKRDW